MPMLPPVPIVPSGAVPFIGNQSMGGNLLQNLGTPLAPSDSAPKGYVDSAASGLAPKLAVQAATAIALPANTYSNGSSGIGATLTGNAVGELIVDSHPVALNDRILVQNEVDEVNNGPYTCTTAGATGSAYVLTRATDANTGANLFNGSYEAEYGTFNGGQAFYLTNATTPVIGTDSLIYAQYLQGIQAGPGLHKFGQLLEVDGVLLALSALMSATITVAAQQAALELVPGTNVEAWSAVLDALASVMSSTATAAAQRGALGLGTVATEALDTDGTLSADSDANVPSQKAVKSYVDASAAGLVPKIGVLLSTQTALPANTYNNGSSGVGATLTGNSPGVLLIDNVEVGGGDRVLIKDEAAPANNGVYTCTTMGDTGTPGAAYVLTRATDSDTGADLYNGSYWTQEGALNAGTAFYLTNSTVPDIGTDALEYLQYTAGVGVQAGIGLVRLGQTIQVETVLAAVNTVFSPTATAAAQIAALGLVIGTNVEAWSAVLDALAAVMSSTPTAAAQRTALGLGTVATEAFSTDGTMAANSDSNVPSQKAVVTYVQAFLQGLSVKPSVRLATVAALPANTYSNGSSGIGATLTGSAVGVLAVDGNTVNLNDRVLVQNEAAQANNGIYQCTTAGSSGIPYVLTRTADSDTSADLIGAFVFVEAGSTNASSGFVCLNNSTITIGTTGVGFTQFSGAGEITAGTGLSKAGNIISADSVLSALDSVMSATATAAAQRTALGLTIGTNVEAWSAVLDALASVMSSTATVAAQQAALSLVPGTNVEAWSAVLDALASVMSSTATVAAQQAALSLVPGTNVQAYNATLTALGTVMSATATAAAQRTALGLTIGTNVEAWSAVLDALAAVMSSTATAAAQRTALGLGASSVWNNVVRETPSGSVNGTNTTFTLANTPVSGSEQVFLNGLLQEPGAGNDYTISGATITYLTAPLTGDRLRVTYSH